MNDSRTDHRRTVARLADGVLRGTVTYEEFMKALEDRDYDDPCLEDLIDHIEHFPAEPGRLSFLGHLGLGHTREQYEAHVTETRRLINRASSQLSDTT